GGRARHDPRDAPRHGLADGAAARRRRADRDPRRRRGGRRLGPARPAQGGRRFLHPRRAGGKARPVRFLTALGRRWWREPSRAAAAGVERICVVTPQPIPATIAVAALLGIDEVYAIGGAQAIAALAFGTETIRPVDKIVGPGNRWVTAAKVLVSAHVGVDLPAGPSEVVVIADESADPALCLADLRAQAEHGPDSEAVLVTTNPGLADAVGWERTALVDS